MLQLPCEERDGRAGISSLEACGEVQATGLLLSVHERRGALPHPRVDQRIVERISLYRNDKRDQEEVLRIIKACSFKLAAFQVFS